MRPYLALLPLLACDDTTTGTPPTTWTPTATVIAPGTTASIPVQPPLTVLACYPDDDCHPHLDYTISPAGLLTIAAPDDVTLVVWSME